MNINLNTLKDLYLSGGLLYACIVLRVVCRFYSAGPCVCDLSVLWRS